MRRFAKVALLILAGWSLPCAAAAQTATAGTARPRAVSPEEREKLRIEQAAIVQGGRLMTTVESRITAGRPYSADATTESLQVLGDGNRISSKRVTRVFRDNDGRTRREQLGPDGNAQTITINDPVGGTSYTLYPATKTASQGSVFSLAPATAPPSGVGGARGGGGGGAATTVAGVPVARGGGGGRGGAATATTEQEVRLRDIEKARAARVEQAETSQTAAAQSKQVIELAASGGGKPTKEELGEQMIEGVRATGTRTTTIIPAGSNIGNMNEIRIVSEQWFSPDLEVLVLTKHSDPRVGETVYRLTNIIRAQPDPNLFVLPSDYTLRSAAGGARGRGGIE